MLIPYLVATSAFAKGGCHRFCRDEAEDGTAEKEESRAKPLMASTQVRLANACNRGLTLRNRR